MVDKKKKEEVFEGREYRKPELVEYEDLRTLTGGEEEDLTNGTFT